MSNPRVSVVIPTFNRSRLLLRAVQSVLAQTYGDLELIVSDDASPDDTLERLREIPDPRLKVFANAQRLGIVGNHEHGLRQATGEFVIYLGDDDLMLPTALERLVEPLARSARQPELGIGCSWCPCLVADRNSSEFWATEAGPAVEPTTTMLAQLFAGNRGPRASSVMLRRQDALAVGGFDPKYGDLSDIGLWGRAALMSPNVACIAEPLVQYTMHQGNTTARSSVEKWQNWARVVLADMVSLAREHGDEAGARELLRSRTNFISGITLTILMQTIGKPGWVRGAFAQMLRTPGAFFTPYMLRRFIKDGSKVFKVRASSRGAYQAS